MNNRKLFGEVLQVANWQRIRRIYIHRRKQERRNSWVAWYIGGGFTL